MVLIFLEKNFEKFNTIKFFKKYSYHYRGGVKKQNFKKNIFKRVSVFSTLFQNFTYFGGGFRKYLFYKNTINIFLEFLI